MVKVLNQRTLQGRFPLRYIESGKAAPRAGRRRTYQLCTTQAAQATQATRHLMQYLQIATIESGKPMAMAIEMAMAIGQNQSQSQSQCDCHGQVFIKRTPQARLSSVLSESRSCQPAPASPTSPLAHQCQFPILPVVLEVLLANSMLLGDDMSRSVQPANAKMDAPEARHSTTTTKHYYDDQNGIGVCK